MASQAIERLFWDLGNDRELVTRYRQDPDPILGLYRLTDAERAMIKAMDMKALEGHGVSNMLLLTFWNLIHAGNPLAIFEFYKAMNGGRVINRMKIPGWQFVFIRIALALLPALRRARRAIGFQNAG